MRFLRSVRRAQASFHETFLRLIRFFRGLRLAQVGGNRGLLSLNSLSSQHAADTEGFFRLIRFFRSLKPIRPN